MKSLSLRQFTLRDCIEFSGYGVHSALPSTLTLEPAPADSGIRVRRILDDDKIAGPVPIHISRIADTHLCTTLDLGDSVTIATIEHVVAALSGLGVDNALISVKGSECPIIDGSAMPFVEGIMEVGLKILPQKRKFIKIKRPIMVRDNEAFAALEPGNGRKLDIDIDFKSKIIGRQRMKFDWSPRKFVKEIANARTFGFLSQADGLRQCGHALGSSTENSIVIDEHKIMNKEGLRFDDEFVRHKLLDAIGDLALGGLPIYGHFRSYKGGHKLNSLVISSMLSSKDNYEVVEADKLPLPFDGLDDFPQELKIDKYLRSVG